MPHRLSKAALLDTYPSLREVLDWWSKREDEREVLKALQEEIARIQGSRKRLAAVWRSAAHLAGETAEGSGYPDLANLDSSLHRLLWNFAIADEMALRYQDIQRWDARRILVFVALFGAGFWVLKYASLLLPGILFGSISLGMTLGAGLVGGAGVASFFERIRFKRNRGRYLLSRTLAETLRVEFAQRLAGTRLDTVGEFSRQHEVEDEAAFPKAVLNAALECAGVPPAAALRDGLRQARVLWLEDQLRFFGDPGPAQGGDRSKPGRVELERKGHRRAERRMKLGITGVVLFLVSSLAMWGGRFWLELPADWEHIMSVVGAGSELLTALFGLSIGYYHQVSALHAVTAQKYHRARLYLIDSLASLDSVSGDEERRAILAGAGKLALAETADWGVHQREHTPRAAFR